MSAQVAHKGMTTPSQRRFRNGNRDTEAYHRALTRLSRLTEKPNRGAAGLSRGAKGTSNRSFFGAFVLRIIMLRVKPPVCFLITGLDHLTFSLGVSHHG